MKLKQLIFSIALLTIATTAKAETDSIYQVTTFDTIYIASQPTSKYDMRVHRYMKKWSNLIPAHFKIQYAGNMGFMSVGVGWDYGRRRQWETDIMIGYIPRYATDQGKITFSFKQNYIPWSFQIKNSNWAFEPLECGIYLNTLPYKEFWYRNPKRYGKGYYEYCSRMRVNIFAGQRLSFDIPNNKRHFVKSVTAFYEVSSYDMMLITAFQNKTLKANQYLTLSVGLKFQII